MSRSPVSSRRSPAGAVTRHRRYDGTVVALPTLRRHDDSWKSDGLCTEADPELFFPDNPHDPVDEAKAVCARCPVQETCLDFALTHGIEAGVWGGVTEVERRRMRRDTENEAA